MVRYDGNHIIVFHPKCYIHLPIDLATVEQINNLNLSLNHGYL